MKSCFTLRFVGTNSTCKGHFLLPEEVAMLLFRAEITDMMVGVGPFQPSFAVILLIC